MKIIQLKSENVKRLQAVEIRPDGNVVVIGGKNGAGKSSVLDSIQWALAGKPDAPLPVRKGEAKAHIVADLGDLVVARTITPQGGGSLVVRNADGVKQDSPQTILDKLVGKLTFDPLEFSRQKPAQQAETLRSLVGLDFAALEKEREKQFNARTAVNAEVKALKARLDALPKYDGVPEQEQSTGAIMAEQAKALAVNANNREQRQLHDASRRNLETTKSHLAELEDRARKLEETIKQQRRILAEFEADFKTTEAVVAGLKDLPTDGFLNRLQEVEETNRKIRCNEARKSVVQKYKEKIKSAEDLTDALVRLDSQKRERINTAKYPIEGLAFDLAGGVEWQGIPFEQCSSAEQLRVSVAIGLALNPKLKILLIRDGSLLDPDSLKIIGEMAAKADAQVWLERVGVDAATSVIIEDGHVQILFETKEANS